MVGVEEIVDNALVQEHFKANKATPLCLFGRDWWNVSSDAVGRTGRKSGGCAAFVQIMSLL